MEIGIHSFGELVPDPHTHQKISAHERLKNVIRMAIMADEVGLDVFGFGEHHRLDIAASAPPVVLAAIAQATKHIRLTSTATVLSSDAYADEVRADEQRARAIGISGVPFFAVDERYGVSGAQPTELFGEVLERAWAESHPLIQVGSATQDEAGSCDGENCTIA